MAVLKPEYPRMQFRRDAWMNLNGTWDFEFDDDNIGLKEQWYKREGLNRKIEVPFAFQTELSQIQDTSFHDYVWYMKYFKLDETFEGKDVLLHFGAVDYECVVFLNDAMVCRHVGGHTSFSVDITPNLKAENKLAVYVKDPSQDETIPRGKQFWLEDSRSIWYTRTTGIWQSVWLEPVDPIHIKKVRITPDVDAGTVEIEARFSCIIPNLDLSTYITLDGKKIQTITHRLEKDFIQFTVDIFQKQIFSTPFHNNGLCWTPESPTLFDIAFELKGDRIYDTGKSYFGMRKIHTEDGMIYLNNRRYYQKLVLDQGYWPQSLLTAPSDQALIDDIEHAKKMGFNGCRKHQKVEEERFLYWADKLGYLVWEEMPSGIYYDENYVERASHEWMEVIQRDYNHPSIVTWVPLNESWAVPNAGRDEQQQSHCMAMYHLTRSIDRTRLVISNDGWEMMDSDICAIHNYNHGNIEEDRKKEYFKNSLKTRENILQERPNGKKILIRNQSSSQIPILLTEFGGIAFQGGKSKSWGYSSVSSEEEFLEEYQRIIEAIYDSDVIDGFCYTQFTDVEFEINGLLTCDRKPKLDCGKIKEINDLHFMKTVKD